METLLSKAKALADPTRLKLLRMVLERECAVHELVSVLDMGQSRVSQHLSKLKAAGLVRERRDGREVYYAADPQSALNLDLDLLSFLYAPMDRIASVPEWHRWRHLLGPDDTEPTAGSGTVLPVVFRPQPAVARAGEGREKASSRLPRILFLCTANSFRSQIAEAWARALGGADTEVQSAGLEATRIHPLAVAVMAEVGIDMSGQHAKSMTPGMLADSDVVVTLCGALLGWFPATRRNVQMQHWPFPDPAAFVGSEAELLAEARRVRDGIRLRVEGLLTSLQRVS